MLRFSELRPREEESDEEVIANNLSVGIPEHPLDQPGDSEPGPLYTDRVVDQASPVHLHPLHRRDKEAGQGRMEHLQIVGVKQLGPVAECLVDFCQRCVGLHLV